VGQLCTGGCKLPAEPRSTLEIADVMSHTKAGESSPLMNELA
jgi:hypothetical protein